MTSLTQSYYCGASDTQIIYQTIGNYFDQICEKFPDSEALVVCHQDIRWTYSEFQREVNRLATGMLALGIAPGDRVGIWGANCVEWVMVQYATAKIGAIMVCINPAYRLYDLPDDSLQRRTETVGRAVPWVEIRIVDENGIVVGIGEKGEICTWVQLQPGASMTEVELKAFCKDQITHFKIPHYVRFVAEFPMTVTGKMQKFVMREAMAAELGL